MRRGQEEHGCERLDGGGQVHKLMGVCDFLFFFSCLSSLLSFFHAQVVHWFGPCGCGEARGGSDLVRSFGLHMVWVKGGGMVKIVR